MPAAVVGAAAGVVAAAAPAPAPTLAASKKKYSINSGQIFNKGAATRGSSKVMIEEAGQNKREREESKLAKKAGREETRRQKRCNLLSLGTHAQAQLELAADGSDSLPSKEDLKKFKTDELAGMIMLRAAQPVKGKAGRIDQLFELIQTNGALMLPTAAGSQANGSTENDPMNPADVTMATLSVGQTSNTAPSSAPLRRTSRSNVGVAAARFMPNGRGCSSSSEEDDSDESDDE